MLVFAYVLIFLAEAMLNSAERDCFEPRNYIILFDDNLPVEDMWSLTQFVAAFGSRLRVHNAKNRLAIGTFNEIKLPLGDSEFRNGFAFEQAVLDLKLENVRTSIKTAAEKISKFLDSTDSKVPHMIVFVVGSKGKSEAENLENAEAAKMIFKDRNHVTGYAIGLGENLHDGTLKALSGRNDGKNVWTNDELIGLDDHDFVVSNNICSSE